MSNVFEPFTSAPNGPAVETPEPKKRGRPRKAAAPAKPASKRARRPALATAAVSAPEPTPQANRKPKKVVAKGSELEERMIAELARLPAVAKANLLKKLNRIFA